MKRIMLASAILALSACSSPPAQLSTPAQAVTTEQVESLVAAQYGSVQVVSDKKGQWVEISSTGSAAVTQNTAAAQDAALKLALTVARRNISEFMGTNVATNTITTTTNDGDKSSVSSKETVSERSAALLKGMTIDQQLINGDRAVVKVVIRRQNVNAARNARIDMLK